MSLNRRIRSKFFGERLVLPPAEATLSTIELVIEISFPGTKSLAFLFKTDFLPILGEEEEFARTACFALEDYFLFGD